MMSDFHFQINPRLKSSSQTKSTEGTQNRSAIYIFKSDPDFEIAIAITIPIKKPIRINQDPVFMQKSDRDWKHSADPVSIRFVYLDVFFSEMRKLRLT
jgi:hypothetical protein